MKKLTVGLFNDSFPPTIDGVANVTVNYARVIQRDLGRAIVATPFYPGVTDDYPYEVIRYPSAYIKNEYGYRAGYPFDPVVLGDLEHEHIDIIHAHCPVVSTVLGRMLRRATGAPIVFTYHTKYDIDINNLMTSETLRKTAIKFLLNNIKACDEVWVVSEGAGDNLRSLGYEGDCRVMRNGTDFEKRRAPDDEVQALREEYKLPPGLPVFLFVGRMMWYKGVKLSLDGLRRLKAEGQDFRFFLVGDGADRKEIEEYIGHVGLGDRCILTGAVRDREKLRAFFTLADLFLFPSECDTNGIVVSEAAACSCASVLLKGSCAAEGVTDGTDGLVIENTVDAMQAKLRFACENRSATRAIGEAAARNIYLSWDDAVRTAYERYEVVLESFKARQEDEAAIRESVSGISAQFLEELHMSREQFSEFLWNARSKMEQLRERSSAYTHELIDLLRWKRDK